MVHSFDLSVAMLRVSCEQFITLRPLGTSHTDATMVKNFDHVIAQMRGMSSKAKLLSDELDKRLATKAKS